MHFSIFHSGAMVTIELQLIVAAVISFTLYWSAKKQSNGLSQFLAILSIIVPCLIYIVRAREFSLYSFAEIFNVAVLLAIIGWEQLAPRVRYEWSSPQFTKSVIYNYVRPLIGGIVGIALVVPIGRMTPRIWSMEAHHVPLWLQFVLLTFFFDFMEYFWHRALHHFNFLWRLHEIHHTTEELNTFAWSNSNLALIMASKIVTIAFTTLLIGPSAAAYILNQIVSSLINGFLAHANVDFPRLDKKLPFWSYIVLTPNFHAHHHTQAGMNSNFAQNFLICDWLFGTLQIPTELPVAFGTGSKKAADQGIWADQIYPLLPENINSWRRGNPKRSPLHPHPFPQSLNGARPRN